MVIRFKVFFLATLVFFVVLQAPQVWSVTLPSSHYPLPLSGETRRVLSSFRDILTPFLSGTLSKKAYLQLFEWTNRAPSGISLVGEGLQIGEVFDTIFPGSSKVLSLEGTADFKILIKKTKQGMDHVKVTVTVHSLGSRGAPSILSEEARIDCKLILDRKTLRAAGTVTCHLIKSVLMFETPLKIRVGISGVTLQERIMDRSFRVTGKAVNIDARDIRWSGRFIKQIHAGSLLLTPEGLTLKSLYIRERSHTLSFKILHLKFFPLTLTIVGSHEGQLIRMTFSCASHVRKVGEDVSLNLKENFQPPVPVLSRKAPSGWRVISFPSTRKKPEYDIFRSR